MQHTQNQFSHSEAKAKFTSTFLKLLQSRNVGPEFLSWDLKTIGDITNLFDLETAAIRLLEAIKNNEKIAVYGDYDVDGTTSCALLFHFFKFFNLEVDLIQPSRFIEGYGVHVSSIDEAINRNVDVLITVDCGITGHDAAEYAKHRGLDLIITDHHADANETLPEAFAIINPNRKDETCPSELKALAGVGVAFALALKMKQLFEQNPDNEKPLPSLYPLLQFLAVGTISDLAPINTLNARLIRHGLKQLPKSQYQGLRQFLSPEEKKLEVLPSEKVSFNIGPLINSKGRLEHPEQALQLLTYSDPNDCFELYNVLNESNSE
ncbi:MAG: single-stranded-DNA-specific exonuclease RecJ, partial [Bacteriovoracaceae bacterium]